MQSIFDPNVRAGVIKRIDSLTPAHKPHWGTMTVLQMVKHCSLCEEYYYGNIKVSRSFIGLLFGRKAIAAILKDENAGLRKNAPTAKPFRVNDLSGDLETEKSKWRSLIGRYGEFHSEKFTHWFFGSLTKEQLGQFIYKHSDHHLKQFGV